MEFKEIVKRRYATKKFDGKQLTTENVDALFELIRFSASSYGLQPYRIVSITDANVKAQLAPASWNQPQITTCSHLLVFCADDRAEERIKGYERMMKQAGMPEDRIKTYGGMMRGDLTKRSKEAYTEWAKRQCYLALGNAINGAKSLGFDSCPMEGFSPDEYKKILKLPAYLHPVCIATFGKAADTQGPKLRYTRNELFIE
ncbi:MAG: NAD(P)H-dependent oxidoreductase [Nanoarchaeota archaeon]|nr:NAD(P)H-dependent oxidoreductase [Nanoarchaeota archaeon]